jgi:shikimate dehydrogenase
MRATLTICNRTESRAEELVRHLNIKADIRSLEHAPAEMGKADLVINTLSIGQTGQALDLPEGKLRTFYDISYGKPAQAMLGRAEAAGWKPLDGLSMLVAQAAFSFEMWFGILPDMQGALARCRKLVEATS